jgi:hypothetical protein
MKISFLRTETQTICKKTERRLDVVFEFSSIPKGSFANIWKKVKTFCLWLVSMICAVVFITGDGYLISNYHVVIEIASAKLDASAALAASGALPENVNYAVKSGFLLGFLESVPGVEAKLKNPNTVDEKFEDVVKAAQQAAVLVLVY